LLLRRPARESVLWRDHLAKKALTRQGRGAQRARDFGERPGLAKLGKPPSVGRSRKARSPNCKAKCNLRGKRSDP
jgi:hypothetical protein